MRRSFRAASVAALAVVAALLVPGTAYAAPDLGPVLPSLPASGSGGGVGDDVLNTLVATACDGGVPLTAPAWFQLPAGTTGSVFARARVVVQTMSSPDVLASTRVAIVDVSSETVLSCTGSPASVPSGHTAAAVVRVAAAEWSTVQATCGELGLCPSPAEVFVDRGVGAPGNDDVATATVVPSLPYTTTGSTALATDDGPDTFSSCAFAGGTVDQPVSTAWWRWTAPADGYLTAAATATTWSPCTGIADADPAVPPPAHWFGADDRARPQFPVVAGRSYLVRVAAEYDITDALRPLQTGGPFTLKLSFTVGPGPATDLVAAASAPDALTVSWQPPASSSSSSPVTGYDVAFARSEPGAASTVRHLAADETSTIFAGLALGYYDVTVTARSAAGAGLGVGTTGVLLAPPGPPALLLRSDSPGEVTASWLAPVPAPFTEVPDSYVVTLQDTAPGSAPVSRSISAFDALRTTFTGLVSGHSYDVTVVGTSSGAGAGTPSTRRITLESAGGTGPLAGVPTALVRRGDRSVTAIWTPPAYTGTSGITAYRVRVFLGTTRTLVRSAVVSGSRRSAIIGGLVNGRAYTLDVAAVNGAGAGAVRRSNLVTPATRPGAPVLGRAASGAPGGTTSASITWSAPRSTGGLPVRGYVVTAWRYDRAGHLVSARTSSLRPAAARSLVWSLPLGWYRFSVRSVNAVGPGATTGRSAQVVSR